MAMEQAPQGIPHIGTSVDTIINLKPLQQDTATMITHHMLRQVVLYPDSARDTYHPNNEVIITLNSYDCDWINFKDSVLLFKLKIKMVANRYSWDNHRAAESGGTTSPLNSFDHTLGVQKILSLGSASLIKRIRVSCGTTQLQDIERYDIFLATLAESQAPRGFQDLDTLLNCTKDSYPYNGPLEVDQTLTDEYAETATSVWVKVPMITILNDVGFTPIYMLSSKIKLIITLADNNSVWKPDLRAPTVNVGDGVDNRVTYFENTVADGAGGRVISEAIREPRDGDYVVAINIEDDVAGVLTPEAIRLYIADPVGNPQPGLYLHYVRFEDMFNTGTDFSDRTINHTLNNLGSTESIPGVRYLETGFSIDTDPNPVVVLRASEYTYSISDIALLAHGLTVTAGGELDDAPQTVYTDSYLMMHTPTTGNKRERHTFQVKKSSISAVHGVFIDPRAITSQVWTEPSTDMWLRAGALGSVYKNTTGETPEIYDPSIQWWSIELGGRRFPTATGTGDLSPDQVNGNISIMWNEYQRFLGRNDVAGYTFPPSLSQNNELDHGTMRNADAEISTIINHIQPDLVGDPNNRAYDISLETSLNSHPYAILPNHYGYSHSMFGGPTVRRGVKKFSNGDSRISIATDDEWPDTVTAEHTRQNYNHSLFFDRAKWVNQSVGGLTGCKFIMACSLTPIDHAEELIQGADTERYDLLVQWQRREKIIPSMSVPSGFAREMKGGPVPILVADRIFEDDHYVENTVMPIATITESIPDFYLFFRYNVKLVFENGLAFLMDFFHYLLYQNKFISFDIYEFLLFQQVNDVIMTSYFI